jgi:hypothetical protein
VTTKEPIPKDYMGDGVYIKDVGFGVELTTENGISVQNTVFIEPLTWKSMVRYMARVEENHK